MLVYCSAMIEEYKILSDVVRCGDNWSSALLANL